VCAEDPCTLWNRAISSVSAADGMAEGDGVYAVSFGLSLKKKVPPTRLHAFASERHYASL
jgi:hypothetical protein